MRHEPSIITDDMVVLRQCAMDGVGVAQLPLLTCRNEIRDGLLEVVLPDFPSPLYEIQVVFRVAPRLAARGPFLYQFPELSVRE